MIAAVGYIQPVTKRLVEIDDNLLERAKAITGQTTIRATIETALKRVVGDDLIRRHIERLRDPDGYELTPEQVDALRDPDYVLDDDD